MKYKKIIRLVFFIGVLSSSWSLSAQDTLFSEFALGIRQGYQFSRINFSPSVPQGLNQGFTSGLILQYFSQRQLGFQMEVNYSQRGWNAPAFGQPVEYRREMDYLEIPFLTHFAIGKKSFRFVINLGSYISFLLNDKAAVFGGSPIQSYYRIRDINTWSYGLTGGLGVALRTKIGVFQAEGRGALGLTDTYDPLETVFEGSPEQFFGYQFSYLYRFGARKRKAAKALELIEEPKETIPDENPTGDF